MNPVSLTTDKQQHKRQFAIACALALLLTLVLPKLLWAHPLGNFTVNRYSRLELKVDQINLLYIVDMAEIPTQQERFQIDTNGDKQVDAAEQEAYLVRQIDLFKDNLSLLIDDTPVALVLEDGQIEFPPGQANLPLLRITAQFVALLPPQASPWQVDYRDENYQERLGWREVVVWAGSDVTLLQSNVPSEDVSQELRNYPSDLLQSPLDRNTAAFRFALGGSGRASTGSTVNPVAGAVANVPGVAKPNDRFAELITMPTLGPGTILLALLAAFGWGAFHALSPGHGKTIVAAYLVGSRGAVRHALFLGVTTTITHTAGVFALGFVTLFASRFILPEKLYPWLGLISGLLVVTIGVSLVWGRTRSFFGLADPDLNHSHDANDFDENQFRLGHTHGGLSHSHAPVGADGSPVRWRNLLALGISGGLLPCPSALVMMLAAITLQRITLGLILIFVFSIGLASVLTGIGILLVHASQWFTRIPESGRLLRVMPVVSAAFITVVGIVIAWQALMQTGILSAG